MALSPGSRLGPYEVSGPLGVGGMGEVYRARDSKLERDVALKVLPTSLAGDADYMARFRREAQVLASLNHPNIAAIYGLEENAIVMELVEGQTLDERIRQGPLPLEEALPVARQIAEALEAAHERGIIHRDLKPANIKVTPQGTVKVLDFGLAKAVEQSTEGRDPAASPTLTLRATQAGLIMGTPGYLSPEQAAGKPLDRRADIWAFGVVLWEMFTGRRLFEGETISHTLADVLRADIDLDKLPAGTPKVIRNLIKRCLDRDLKNRLQWIGEARIIIQSYLTDPAAAEPAPAPASVPQRWQSWLPWAAVLAVTIAGAIGWWRATRPAPLRPLVRLNAEMAADTPLARGMGSGMLALSPDGVRLALTMRAADGKVRLHTRLLHQSQVTSLPGTDNAGTPFFSPDGQWIAFAADGKLKKISVEGGASVTLCDAPAIRGASWGDDGNIVLSSNITGGLMRVPAGGGTPTTLTKVKQGERTHRWPQVLPGSQAVLFTAHTAGGGGNYDDANVDVISLKTGERKTVQRGGFSGHYLRTSAGAGHLVYMHQSTLFAVPFDVDKLAPTGPAVPVLEDVGSTGLSGGDFTYSSTGSFVYVAGKSGQSGWTISWLDNTGKSQPLHAAPGGYFTPRLSPDGKRLAFTMTAATSSDIWVKDLARDTPSRLSFLQGLNRYPVWTPDGNSIVFQSQGGASPGLYRVRSDGAGEAQRLTEGKVEEVPYSVSPDGKRLAFFSPGNAGSMDIFTASMEGDTGRPRLGKPELFLGTPFVEVTPAFSPDGRWLAYSSNESTTFEIYVRPFPGPGGRWQISTGGGSFPAWSRAGGELFFSASDGRLMAVSYSAKGDSFTAAKPRVWSETLMRQFGIYPSYDVAPDGKRVAGILANPDEQQKPLTHLTFLLNFFDELRRRAPAGK